MAELTLSQGGSIVLRGENVQETGRLLVEKLSALGHRTEEFGADLHERLGPGAGFACRLLTRNGVFVVVTHPDIRPDCDCLHIDLNPHDAPDFAAEKALDALEEAGLIALDAPKMQPEQDDAVRQRLKDLGYL